MAAQQRHHVCVVPTVEMLDLAAELAALGGGEVAAASCWVGPLTEAHAAARPVQLDACCSNPASLIDALQQELWPWLHRGFPATVGLLGNGKELQPQLAASAVASKMGAAALSNGMELGFSWQLVSSSSIHGPLGVMQQQQQQQQQAAFPSSRAPAKREQAAAGQQQRPSSRLGRDAASQDVANEGGAQLASCVIRATSEAELEQLLAAVAHQQAAVASAAVTSDEEPPSLLLHLTLLAADGQPAAALHVIQPASTQQPQLLELLHEVADLHQRRREGEHLLAGTKLSQLNQVAVPLVAGAARLFLAADASSAGGSSEAARSQQQHMLDLLSAARYIRAVCAKGAAVAASSATGSASGCNAVPPATWLPCQQFLQQLEQRRQAEQQRQAETAALAAAEADRREKLRLAAKQRQQQVLVQQQGPASSPAVAEQQACDAVPPQRPLPLKQQQRSPQLPPQPQSLPAQHTSSSPQPAADHPAAYALLNDGQGADEAGTGDVRGSSGGLQQLRQQFHSLYLQTVGNGAASVIQPPAAAGKDGSSGGSCTAHRQQGQAQSARIATGVAAADNIAIHAAVMHMQAAAEAMHSRRAQHEQLDEPNGERAAPDAATAGGLDDGTAFSWAGHSGSSGCLGQLLEEELMQLRQVAGGRGVATCVAASTSQAQCCAGESELAGAELDSLADLDAPAPSLGAMYNQPVSRLVSSSGSEPRLWNSQNEQQPVAEQLGTEPESSSYPPRWTSVAVGASAELTPTSGPVSDFFKSELTPLRSPQRAAAAVAPAYTDGLAITRPAGCFAWQHAGDCSATSCSAPLPRPLATGALELQSSVLSSICSGSYAVAGRQQQGEAVAAPPFARLRVDSSSRPSAQQELNLVPSPPSAAASVLPTLPPADVAELLAELEREQRINAALLLQLHGLQQQLEEVVVTAAATATAAVHPLAPGVDDPADFNGLLAALQLERQQHAMLRQQFQLQQQQAEEQRLALEAEMHTQHRHLLVAAARCRAWEGQSPLAGLFQRYDEDMRRLQAQCQRLAEESSQMALMLAEADLQHLAEAAEQLPEDASTVCRDHQRKLQQALAQVSKLQQECAALQKRLHGAERRDRLAELCHKQAESGMKASAELRQQLAVRERQLEAQSLAAAAAVADATRLRDQLESSEVQLGRALAEKADLQDSVESLRKQISLLRGQASRDRILRSMQLPATQ